LLLALRLQIQQGALRRVCPSRMPIAFLNEAFAFRLLPDELGAALVRDAPGDHHLVHLTTQSTNLLSSGGGPTSISGSEDGLATPAKIDASIAGTPLPGR